MHKNKEGSNDLIVIKGGRVSKPSDLNNMNRDDIYIGGGSSSMPKTVLQSIDEKTMVAVQQGNEEMGDVLNYIKKNNKLNKKEKHLVWLLEKLKEVVDDPDYGFFEEDNSVDIEGGVTMRGGGTKEILGVIASIAIIAAGYKYWKSHNDK